MAATTEQHTIDSEIADYVGGLSAKNKLAVLTVVKTMAEAEEEATFEREWAEGIPLGEAFEHVKDYIKTLPWEEKLNLKRSAQADSQ